MLIKQFIRGIRSYHEIPKILKLDGIEKNVEVSHSPSGLCVTTEYTILSNNIRIWAYRFSCSGVPSRHTVCYTNNSKPNQPRTYYFKDDLWSRIIYNKIVRRNLVINKTVKE